MPPKGWVADIERKFWLKVSPRDRGECWEWEGAKTDAGYGKLYRVKGYHRAHRVSWEISQGGIPDGMLVLHTCDNPPCVNPSHLYLGTGQDNVDDMMARGREYRHNAETCKNGHLYSEVGPKQGQKGNCSLCRKLSHERYRTNNKEELREYFRQYRAARKAISATPTT